MTTDELREVFATLRDEVRRIGDEGRRRGEDTMRLVRSLGTDMLKLDKRVSDLESASAVQRRVSQEGDEMQMAALTSALDIQNRAINERLTKQDAMLAASKEAADTQLVATQEQTAAMNAQAAATTALAKKVGHPILRAIGIIFGLALTAYATAKGIKLPW